MDIRITDFSPLLAQSESGRYENPQLFLYAMVPFILALIVFAICLKRESFGLGKGVKWAALIPLVIGAMLGLDPARKFYTDPLYVDMFGGGGFMRVLHTLPIATPVIGAIVLFVWSKISERSVRSEDI